MAHTYRVPLELDRQPDGGFVVTSPVLPELLTEGDSIDEALHNAEDAFRAVLEIYSEEGRPLPAELPENVDTDSILTERIMDLRTPTVRSAIDKLGLQWNEFQEA